MESAMTEKTDHAEATGPDPATSEGAAPAPSDSPPLTPTATGLADKAKDLQALRDGP